MPQTIHKYFKLYLKKKVIGLLNSKNLIISIPILLTEQDGFLKSLVNYSQEIKHS